MDLKNTIKKRIKELDAQGRTSEILEETKSLLREIHGERAWAYYYQKKFEEAETEALKAENNETAFKCLAAIAAYHHKDQDLVECYTDRLPDSPAKDNVKTIIARSPDDDTPEDEIIKRAEKWTMPDLWDPLNVANLLNNTARWLIAKGKNRRSLEYASRYMIMAVNLYGDEENNLYHRAGAYFWISIIRELSSDREGAIYAAAMSVRLWKKQLIIDPNNKSFQNNFADTKKRLEKLSANVRD